MLPIGLSFILILKSAKGNSFMDSKNKYTLKSKIGFGLVDILGGGSFSLISLLFLSFLVTIEGITPAVAGVVVMIGKLWDAFIDPFLGMLSDRTRSKYGRRRIYLLIGVVPVIVTFALLWYSFGIKSMAAKAVYYAVMYSLFTISYSIIQVPYNALLPDMVEDYEQRASYSTFRILVSNISATISVTVPSLILGAESARTTKSYLIMGIIFGLFYGLPVLAGFLSTWENPISEEERDTGSVSVSSFFSELKESFRNKAYRQYLGIFCWGQMATDLVSAMAAFWLLDILCRQGMMTIFSGVVMIAGLLALPVYNWMAKKHGKQYPAMICMPFRCLALIIAFFMGKNSGMVALILVCILNGIGTGASSFVPYSLLPDLPDSEEMISGKRSSGVYAGLSTFIRTASSGIAVFVAGVVLEMFGYVESTAGVTMPQTPVALFGVKFLFMIIPIILSAIVVWLGFKYTLTKERHSKMMEAIAFRRENGKPTEDSETIKACEAISGIPFGEMWVGGATAEEGTNG